MQRLHQRLRQRLPGQDCIARQAGTALILPTRASSDMQRDLWPHTFPHWPSADSLSAFEHRFRIETDLEGYDNDHTESYRFGPRVLRVEQHNPRKDTPPFRPNRYWILDEDVVEVRQDQGSSSVARGRGDASFSLTLRWRYRPAVEDVALHNQVADDDLKLSLKAMGGRS